MQNAIVKIVKNVVHVASVIIGPINLVEHGLCGIARENDSCSGSRYCHYWCTVHNSKVRRCILQRWLSRCCAHPHRSRLLSTGHLVALTLILMTRDARTVNGPLKISTTYVSFFFIFTLSSYAMSNRVRFHHSDNSAGGENFNYSKIYT